jgi:SAM-dependent methyltransferase
MRKPFEDGPGYEDMMGRHSTKLAPLFADFVSVQDEGQILDIGCGTGSLTQELLHRAHRARVFGVDPSPGFVEHSRKRFAQSSRATIEQANALQLPYADRSFDAVLSLLVLMFVPHPDKALAEACRIAKPGGTVAACVWDATGMKMGALFREEASKLDPAFSGGETRNKFATGDLSRLWRQAGLNGLEETSIEIRMEFNSFDHYWQAQLHGGGPATAYTDGLPQEHVERLRAAVMKRHLGDGPDRAYSLPAFALAIKGTVPR